MQKPSSAAQGAQPSTNAADAFRVANRPVLTLAPGMGDTAVAAKLLQQYPTPVADDESDLSELSDLLDTWGRDAQDGWTDEDAVSGEDKKGASSGSCSAQCLPHSSVMVRHRRRTVLARRNQVELRL